MHVFWMFKAKNEKMIFYILIPDLTSMNKDIIYEILKYLHLCPEENGGVLLSKKIIFSQKSYLKLEKRRLEKPLVFSTSLFSKEIVIISDRFVSTYSKYIYTYLLDQLYILLL
jgi:hypothetical protein